MGEQIELACIDAEPIVIVSARRARTKTLLGDGHSWTSTDFFLITSGGEELEFGGMYDLLDIDEWRNEAAAKTFRVIDAPLPDRWLQIVAGLLVMLQAAPLEEIVRDEREDVSELKNAA